MSIATAHHEGTLLAVKVVPGASREKIVGPLGERLKVTVRKPPEKGAANAAVCQLLAKALGLREADVAVIRGEVRPEKDIVVRGLAPEEVMRRLGLA
jgi:uncharacterized protein (TIGR00251 family)